MPVMLLRSCWRVKKFMPDCLFCKIVNREIPAAIVYEDEQVLAFKDIAPQAPVHLLIIPKKHIVSLAQLTADDLSLIAHLTEVVKKLALENDLAEKGYRVVVNIGAEGGQAVGHLHYHLLGGRQMNWPPG